MKLFPILSAALSAVAATVALSLPVAATSFTYTATLNGASEQPANSSLGTGFVTVTLDDVTSSMNVQASFSNLTGPSGTTAAHIHCCTVVPFSGNVGVATQTPSFVGFPLGVTSGAYTNTFDMMQAFNWNSSFITAHGGTVASAFTAFSIGLNGGNAYFNIHTSVFPGGEIRGFLASAPVPEPGTFALLALGLGALAFVGWRRSALETRRG